jgi:hypothetical protein
MRISMVVFVVDDEWGGAVVENVEVRSRGSEQGRV